MGGDQDYKETVKDVILKATTTEIDTSFAFDDIFNIMFGIVEGATSAIPSSTFNF